MITNSHNDHSGFPHWIKSISSWHVGFLPYFWDNDFIIFTVSGSSWPSSQPGDILTSECYKIIEDRGNISGHRAAEALSLELSFCKGTILIDHVTSLLGWLCWWVSSCPSWPPGLPQLDWHPVPSLITQLLCQRLSPSILLGAESGRLYVQMDLRYVLFALQFAYQGAWATNVGRKGSTRPLGSNWVVWLHHSKRPF